MKKKQLLAVLLCGCLAWMGSGCSQIASKEPQEVGLEMVEETKTEATEEQKQAGLTWMSKAAERIEEMESYTGAMQLDFAFINDGGENSATVSTSLAQVYEPLQQEIGISTEGNGESMGSSHFYVGSEGEQLMLYMQYDGVWYKSKVDEDTLYGLLGQYDMKEMIDILLVATQDVALMGEETLPDGRTVQRVEGVVPAELMPATMIYTGTFVATGMATLTEAQMAGVADMPITFWLDEEGNVVQYQYDAGAAYQTIADNLFNEVKDLEGYENAKPLEVSQYELTVTLENLNETESILVPQEALDGQLLDDTTAEETVEEAEEAQE